MADLSTMPLPAPFIVGAARSGTTLLRMMLDAHPNLAIPPESQFIPPIARVCAAAADPAACFLERLTAHHRWRDFHLDDDLVRRVIGTLSPFTVADGFRTVYRLYAERFSKTRWGDKSAAYVRYMREIGQILPEAHFIHLIRDGRDVAVSLRGLWFEVGSITSTAEWWVSRIQLARQQARQLGHYVEVRYEALLIDTESVLRSICEFLALPWDPVMLEYHRAAATRLAETDRDLRLPGGAFVPADERRRLFALVKQPPEISRIGRWRTELADADRRRFEATAGDMLRELGYEVE